MSRKPRADAKLKNLPDEVQEKLYQFYRRNDAEATVVWLKSNYNVKTSTGSVSGFYAWYPSSSLRPAAAFADQLRAQFEKMPQLKIDSEAMAAITQTAFEIKAAQDRDPKLFFALRKAQRDAAKLKLDERKVRLLEVKAALAEKAEGILGDKNLTEEEQAAQVRALFGMG